MRPVPPCAFSLTIPVNDQVVPLYGALFSSISHPAILRAVFIDSAAFQTSDFLANLVVFAARLRNSGLSDHDLLFHVSEALAGALTGVGHSKLYEAEEVFQYVPPRPAPEADDDPTVSQYDTNSRRPSLSRRLPSSMRMHRRRRSRCPSILKSAAIRTSSRGVYEVRPPLICELH